MLSALLLMAGLTSGDEEIIIPTLTSQFGDDEDEQEDEEMRGERSNDEGNWSDQDS